LSVRDRKESPLVPKIAKRVRKVAIYRTEIAKVKVPITGHKLSFKESEKFSSLGDF